MRVLLLSHGCQSRTEGQPKAVLLGKMPDIELRVLTPTRWKDYGTWREPQEPVEKTFDFRPMKIRFPWTGPGQWYLHYYPGLVQQVREFKPDIINVWEEPWSLSAAHACRVRQAVFPSARVVVETEQNIFKRLPPPFDQMRRYVLKRADAMVGRSQESIAVLRKHGYSGNAYLVPNAVDTQLFHPRDANLCRAAMTAETGVDWSDRFIVGFVGRIVIQKGITDLIEAIARCPGDVVLIAIGPITTEVKATVDALVKQLNLADRVQFLPVRQLEHLSQAFGAMDMLAVPSRTTDRWKEQFGRVIIEAHACGVPVIGSSSGAIPDVVGGGGRIFPEQNVVAFAQAILEMHENRAMQYKLGQVGLAQVAKNYSWSHVAEQMKAIYSELLNSEK